MLLYRVVAGPLRAAQKPGGRVVCFTLVPLWLLPRTPASAEPFLTPPSVPVPLVLDALQGP